MSGARSWPAGYLPAEVTTFVGRQDEIIEVTRLLAGSRLVTLTGAPGVGKSRLALRIAAQLGPAFRDDASLIDLAQVRSGSLAGAVARAFGIAGTEPDPLAAVVEFLRDREMLLILDNCEHLVEECRGITDALLRQADQLRILATSRERLHVAGSRTWVVEPLGVPARIDASGTQSESGRERLAWTYGEYAAVMLFAERATAALPTFRVTAHNLQLVIDICRRLDGLPLAIELVAGRIRGLSLHQMLSRLDDVLGSPSTRLRGVPRHPTLTAAVDWSYQLCSRHERIMWTRAAVFSGTFSADDATFVCGDAEIPGEAVAGVLDRLVDKSALLREVRDGEVRYRMLGAIASYGRRRLRETGELELIQHRYLRWRSEMTERAVER